jgi:hypothetical protein
MSLYTCAFACLFILSFVMLIPSVALAPVTCHRSSRALRRAERLVHRSRSDLQGGQAQGRHPLPFPSERLLHFRWLRLPCYLTHNASQGPKKFSHDPRHGAHGPARRPERLRCRFPPPRIHCLRSHFSWQPSENIRVYLRKPAELVLSACRGHD